MKINTNQPELKLPSIGVAIGFDIKNLVDSMMQSMVENKGCGLAANQIGVLLRVVVLNTPGFTGEIINPLLSNGRFEKISKEGCLSYPGITRKIRRFNRITVTGFDRNWNPIIKNLKALSAFAIQHEVDHLDGITIENHTKQV